MALEKWYLWRYEWVCGCVGVVETRWSWCIAMMPKEVMSKMIDFMFPDPKIYIGTWKLNISLVINIIVDD